MDIASIIGLIACFCLMIFGMVWGKDFSVVKGFADMPSALVTFGGSFMCILASYTVPDFVAGLKDQSDTLKAHHECARDHPEDHRAFERSP